MPAGPRSRRSHRGRCRHRVNAQPGIGGIAADMANPSSHHAAAAPCPSRTTWAEASAQVVQGIRTSPAVSTSRPAMRRKSPPATRADCCRPQPAAPCAPCRLKLVARAVLIQFAFHPAAQKLEVVAELGQHFLGTFCIVGVQQQLHRAEADAGNAQPCAVRPMSFLKLDSSAARAQGRRHGGLWRRGEARNLFAQDGRIRQHFNAEADELPFTDTTWIAVLIVGRRIFSLTRRDKTRHAGVLSKQRATTWRTRPLVIERIPLAQDSKEKIEVGSTRQVIVRRADGAERRAILHKDASFVQEQFAENEE